MHWQESPWDRCLSYRSTYSETYSQRTKLPFTGPSPESVVFQGYVRSQEQMNLLLYEDLYYVVRNLPAFFGKKVHCTKYLNFWIDAAAIVAQAVWFLCSRIRCARADPVHCKDRYRQFRIKHALSRIRPYEILQDWQSANLNLFVVNVWIPRIPWGKEIVIRTGIGVASIHAETAVIFWSMKTANVL